MIFIIASRSNQDFQFSYYNIFCGSVIELLCDICSLEPMQGKFAECFIWEVKSQIPNFFVTTVI